MKKGPALRTMLLDLLFSAWIVAAQIWYYSQFKAQLQAVISMTFRRLWH